MPRSAPSRPEVALAPSRSLASFPPPASPAPARLFTLAFTLAFVSHFFHTLAMHSYSHLPGFLAEVGASEQVIGFVFGLGAAVSILLKPSLGKLMDARGRRLLIVSGGALHVVACGGYLLVERIGPWVYTLRVVHGLSESALFAALFTFAADVVPAARRTQGIALFGVSGIVPMALGGLLGDFVLARWSYAALFTIAMGLAAAGFLASLPIRDGGELDGGRGAEPARSFLAAALDRSLLPIWLIGVAFATAISTVFVFLKTFVVHTGIGSVGLFFACYAFSAAVLRLGFGWVPDRFGPERVLRPAVLLLTAGLGLLAVAGSDLEVAASGVLAGLGHGFTFPILAGLGGARSRSAERGVAMSLFTALFDGGVFIGGPLFGAVVERFGYGAMYAAAAMLSAAGLLLFAGVERWRRAAAPETPAATPVIDAAPPSGEG